MLRLSFATRFAELAVDPEGFDHFLHQVFAQKRKTLGNNLRAARYPAQLVARAWPAGVEPLARAEALSLEALAQLYRGLQMPEHS